jgi:hypothetical protein
MSEPAHVYLILLGSRGEVAPLYPWNKSRLIVKKLVAPPPTTASDVVHSPADESQNYRLDDKGGLETVLMLARRTPLPEDVDLTGLIGTPPVAKLRHLEEWAVRGGDESEAVDFVNRGDEIRGLMEDTVEVDEPILQVMSRVRPHFEVVKAVRFAHQGK